MSKKFLVPFITTVLFSAVIVLFNACDVGLGESVDTTPPTISITYPPASAVVRDEFILAGTCADDKGVGVVSVTVKNTETNTDCGTFSATVKGTNWTCSLNAKDADGNYPLLDGKYSFDVTATDTSGRSSGTSSRSLEIDNTAPLFVIQSPGTVEEGKASTFGSILKVSGVITEAHSVPYMTLTVYDSEEKAHTWTEKNINTAGATNVTFARYIAKEGTTKDYLHNNYAEIYKVSDAGTQAFQCTVKLGDSAGVYRTPVFKNKVVAADDTEGNSTTMLWLYDDVYAQLLSSSAVVQYEYSDLMKIWNNTYTEKDATEALSILKESIKDTSVYNEEVKTRLCFKMNKDANPTYEIGGIDLDSASNMTNAAKLTKGQSVTFVAAYGNDKTLFSPATIKIYLFGPFDKKDFKDELLSNIYTNVENYKSAEGTKDKCIAILYDGENGVTSDDGETLVPGLGPYEGSSVSDWNVTLKLPDGIVAGKYYVIAASGKDMDGTEFIQNTNYAFAGETTGLPASISISSPKDDALSNSDGSVLKVAGTIKSDQNNIKSVSYKVTVTDVLEQKEVGTISGTKTFNEDKTSETFEFDLTDLSVGTVSDGAASDIRNPADGKIYKYSFLFEGLDATDFDASKTTISAQIDKKKPEPTISSVTPIAKSEGSGEDAVYYVNGTVSIVCSISETNLKEAKLIIEDGEKAPVEQSLGTSTYKEIKVKTSGYKDENDLKLTLKAIDKAGNENEISKTYYVSQATNVPAINLNASTSVKKEEIALNNNLFGVSSNNKLTGTITDDDGLDTVTVLVQKADGSDLSASEREAAGLEDKETEYDAKGAASYSLDFVLPTTEAKYMITVTAKDKPSESEDAVESKISKYYVAVDAANPTLEFTTTNRAKTSANTAKTVSGTATDSSGIKSLKRYDVDKDNDAAVIKGEAEATVTVKSDGSWTDTIPAGTIGEKSWRKRYVAEDIYGNTTALDFIYKVDAVAPVLKTIGTTAEITASSTTITGTVLEVDDSGKESEAKSVKYLLVKAGGTAPSKTGNVYQGTGSWTSAVLGSSLDSTTKTLDYKIALDMSDDSYTDAVYTVYVAAFDEAGNQSIADEKSSVTFKVDKTKPVVKITSKPSYFNAASADGSVKISGTLTEANIDTLKVTYTVKGASNTETKTVSIENPGATWEWSLPGEGNYSLIEVTATDKAKNVGSDSCSTAYDKVLPDMQKYYDSTITGNWTNNTTQTLQVLINDNGSDGTKYSSGVASVKYYDGSTGKPTNGHPDSNGVALAQQSGSYAKTKSDTTAKKNLYYTMWQSTLSDLTDGEHTIYVLAEDNAGNAATEVSYTAKIDTAKPEITSVTQSKNRYNLADYASKTGITLTVTATDVLSGIASYACDAAGATVASNVITIPYTAFGKTSLENGTKNFTVTVTDNAGNSSQKSITVECDAVRPSVTYASYYSYVSAGVNKNEKTIAENKATVNKTVSVKASVSDTSGVNTTKDAENGLFQVYNSTSNAWEAAKSGTVSYSGGFWTVSGFDTTEYSGTIRTRLVVLDTFGNSSEGELSLTINQDLDRPQIKLSNIREEAPVIKTSTVQVKVTDDDGDTVKEIWAYNGSSAPDADAVPSEEVAGWIKADGSSGDYTIEAGDGVQNWFFYVVDAAGTIFKTYNETALSRPKFMYGDGSDYADKNTASAFTIDQEGPMVTMAVAHGTATAHDGKWGSASEIFGGTSQYMWIRLEITENVGMSKDASNPTGYKLPDIYVSKLKKTVSFHGTPTIETVDGDTVYTYILNPLNLADFSLADGKVSVTAKVYDSANQLGSGGVTISYDTTGPSVKVISPTTAVSDAVTHSVTVKGSVEDSAGISKIEYAIPTKTGTYSKTAGDWTQIAGTSSWEIPFNSGAPESSECLLYYADAVNGDGANYNVVLNDSSIDSVYRVPIYFRVTDSVGNVTVDKDKYVLVDIDGGKPKAWITSPEDGKTTSGTVTVYGGASDDISVTSVKLAYKLDDAASFTEVTANGTNSWKYAIETSTSNTKLYLKVKAFDEEGNTRDYTSPIEVKLDSQTPTIKDLKVVQYGKGKSSGTPISVRDYTAGMYLSHTSVSDNGEWYLTGVAEDNQGVSSIGITKMSSDSVTIIDLEGPVTLSKDASVTTKAVYNFSIMLPTDSSGQIYSLLKPKDNGGAESEQTIKINIDSTKPSLYNTSNAQSTTVGSALKLKVSSKILGTDAKNATVANSNSFFTFGDNVVETESGLAYIAFCFERDGASEVSVYNPMFGTGNKTQLSATSTVPAATKTSAMTTSNKMYLNEDELPVLFVSGLTRSSDDSITSSALVANKNIRKGGLIKIGGGYSKITNIDKTTNVISFNPAVSTSITKAEFVYAQVVDHQLTESDDGNGGIVNDDGDDMIESISQIGTTYSWNASLDTTTIPDGPIYVRVAAIDNAGNVSFGKILTSVTNNRPRIAKVLLGTDLNQSNTFEFRGNTNPVNDIQDGTPDGQSFGEFSYYSALHKTNGQAQSEVKLGSKDFKVKNGLCIIPEITGGNGDSIKYAYQIDSYTDGVTTATRKSATGSNLKAMNTKSALLTTGVSLNSKTYKVVNKSKTIDVADQIGDWGGIIFDNTTLNVNGSKIISVTFWDNTPETTQGSNSQWALLGIPVNVATADSGKPTAVIDPFFWKSAAENSVVEESGHIELEKVTVSGSGESQTTTVSNPKVSGKVKVSGVAYDETLLGSITASFGGKTFVSEYGSTGWGNKTTDSSNTIVSLEVEDVDLSQEGHSVAWTAVIDTEKVAVGTGKSFTVTATDKASKSSTPGAVQTLATEKTGCYKMDVVPYVTRIWTSISPFVNNNPSVFARTASGNYPVRVGEVIAFEGYNLGTNTATVTLPNHSEAITLTNGSVVKYEGETKKKVTVPNTLTIPSDAKSGRIVFKVGSVEASNNGNDNDACGEYTVASGEKPDYKNYYNRQPNGVNNDNLTDDLALDIWQFKNAVEPVDGSAVNVTMKIDPVRGYPGFSFANSVLYFSMPAYESNQGNGDWANKKDLGNGPFSQTAVGMNYGGFSHNTFTYDEYGYSYGAAMCTDTQDGHKTAWFQFFSREAPIPTAAMQQNMNYNNECNASRLDSSSVPLTGDDAGWTVDINRILSPSMAAFNSNGTNAPTDAKPTYVYMAYYDAPVKQVRFRWGTVGAESDQIDGKKTGDTGDFNSSYKTYGLNDYVDESRTGRAWKGKGDGSGRPTGGDSYIKYSNGNNSSLPIQVVAATGVANARDAYSSAKNGGAGKHVSLSLFKVTNQALPGVLVAWYDEANMQLCMAYNTSPTTSTTWNKTVIDYTGGINVKTAVDGAGGVHFAYYDNMNGSDLKYAYLSSYSATTPTIVTVDSYSAVGSKCTLEVAQKNGNWVPYIGYQMNAYLGSPIAAKVAYRTDFTSLKAGADSSEKYTGAWETSIIPTGSIPRDDQINVGLCKTSAGVIKNFPTSYSNLAEVGPGTKITNTAKEMDVCGSTRLYGNGTSNPILGYGIDTGAIEMGQMR